VPMWSSFNVLVLPDFTGDGVSELLTAHSSDPRFPAEVEELIVHHIIGTWSVNTPCVLSSLCRLIEENDGLLLRC